MNEGENYEAYIPSNTDRDKNIMNKTDEIKFFLREFKNLEDQKYDYYYIVPFKWIKIWDAYISDINNSYPPLIDNSDLLDEQLIVKQNMIENIDFVIIPKSVAYHFHDVYKGARRLKTKHRHIYSACENVETCNKHDLITQLTVFQFQHLLDEDRNINVEAHKRAGKEGCHVFSWC